MNCQNTHSHDFDFLINFEVSRKESISDAKVHIKVATFLHDPECIFSNINVIKICAFLHIFFYFTQKNNLTHIFRKEDKPTRDFYTNSLTKLSSKPVQL